MRRYGLLVLCLAGCRGTFDPASYLTGLRVIDVVAKAPEIAPGETTTLTATTFPQNGPTLDWAVCLIPPVTTLGQAINPDCIQTDQAADLILLGNGPSVNVTMPRLQAAKPNALPPLLGVPDASDGGYVPVRLRVTSDGSTVTAFYRLRYYIAALNGIANPNRSNQNPQLAGVFRVTPGVDAGAGEMVDLSMSPPLVHANDAITLRATVTSDSAETYQVLDLQAIALRSVTETMRISWFATAGTFDNDVTGPASPNTTLTLDKHLPPANGNIDIWVVVHDDRGGSDVTHRTLQYVN
jgi:hypothetical protein